MNRVEQIKRKLCCFVTDYSWMRYEVFQPSLIKADTNVFWNWLADIKKSIEISVFLKENKATDNDLKKKKPNKQQLYIGKWVIFIQVCFFQMFIKEGCMRKFLFFVLPGWLVELAWMNVTSSHFSYRKEQPQKATVSLSDVKLCVALKAVCENIWCCMLGCTLVKLLFYLCACI